jgi:hypothetical protein
MRVLFSLFSTHSVAAMLYAILALWLIIDCARTRNFMWIWLILVFPPIGGLAYLFIYKFPEWQLFDRLNRLFFGTRRVKELRHKIHHMNLPYHWVQLGHEYRLQKKWREAAEAYGNALQLEPQDNEAKYGLGVAKLELDEPQASLEILYPLVQANPRLEHGHALITIAQAYLKMGMRAEARQTYEYILQFYSYPEVQFEYAKLLHEMGDCAQAEILLKRLVEDGKNATGFKKREERKIGRKARLFMLRSQA